MSADSIAILKRRLVFNVVNPPDDVLSGMPCMKPSKLYGYRWQLPCAGPEIGFAIGFELGLAWLRLTLRPGCAVSPERMDTAPLELSQFVQGHERVVGRRGGGATSYLDGFFSCIGAYLDHALNARQTLPELRRRLAALDDATLRARCLAILDGKPVADIFDPKGLGFMKLVKPVALAARRREERA